MAATSRSAPQSLRSAPSPTPSPGTRTLGPGVACPTGPSAEPPPPQKGRSVLVCDKGTSET